MGTNPATAAKCEHGDDQHSTPPSGTTGCSQRAELVGQPRPQPSTGDDSERYAQ